VKLLYEAIASHKKSLSKLLERNIGIQVAMFDYLRNIHGVYVKPLIIRLGDKIKLIPSNCPIIIDACVGKIITNFEKEKYCLFPLW